jgi:hypothetical protein
VTVEHTWTACPQIGPRHRDHAIRNEAAFIARSLGAVLDQDYPADRMQVLVADGMSDDATRAIVEEIAATHPAHTVEIVDNPGGVVPTGFNAALSGPAERSSCGSTATTIIADDYVSACVTALGESGADTVGGRMDAQGAGGSGKSSPSPRRRGSASATRSSTTPPGSTGSTPCTWAPGAARSSTAWVGSIPRWCATRTTSSTTGCARRVAGSS